MLVVWIKVVSVEIEQALVINRMEEGRKEDCKKYPPMSGVCRSGDTIH